METRQELISQSLQNALLGLDQHGLAIPEVLPLREDLRAVIREVADLRAEQYALTKRKTGSGPEVAKLREEIGKRVRQLSDLARIHLKGLPGLHEEFRPPRMNAKHADFLEGVARVVRNVQPHRETLHDRGLSRDSMERIERLTSELAELASAPNLDIERRARATRAIPDALQRGRDIVRAIDSSIRVHFAAGSSQLRLWERAKRIPGKPGRPKQKRPTRKS